MVYRKLFKTIGLTILVCVFGSVMITPVFACSPAPGHYPSDFTLEDRIDAAPLVFVGKVAAPDLQWDDIVSFFTGNGNFSYVYEAEVVVDTYYKGTGQAVVTVDGFGFGGGDCLSSVSPGETYLFFADGNMGETLHASYLTVYDAVYRADAEIVSATYAHTQQSTKPIPLPLIQRLQRRAPAVLGIGILIFAVVIILRWFRSTRNGHQVEMG